MEEAAHSRSTTTVAGGFRSRLGVPIVSQVDMGGGRVATISIEAPPTSSDAKRFRLVGEHNEQQKATK